MSEKILIRSTSEGLIILPALDAFSTQTTIVNGMNEVDAAIWNRCRPMVAHHLASGTLAEVHAKASEGKDGTVEVKGRPFADLPTADQEQAVKQCLDRALLEEWARIPKIQQTAIAIKIADQIKYLEETPRQV